MAFVLVVDDEEGICGLVRKVLESGGHDVETAVTGVGALAAVLMREPDVVLLDVKLSDWDGLELARKLRADLPRTRVVLMPGVLTRPEDVGFEVLQKPFSISDLLRAAGGI